jgi:hypothetical protein
MANQANQPNKLNRQTAELTDFLEYLNIIGSKTITEEELEELYNENVEIEFNHHKVSIPFDAVIYNELLNLITNIMKEQ